MAKRKTVKKSVRGAKSKTRKSPARKTGKKRGAVRKAAKSAMDYGPRKDLGASPGTYIGSLAEPARTTVATIHEMVVAADPAITGCIKWGMPVYELNGMMCYCGAFTKHVTLGFYRGMEFKDARLEGDSKGCGHIKFPLEGPVDRGLVNGLLAQAVALHKQG